MLMVLEPLKFVAMWYMDKAAIPKFPVQIATKSCVRPVMSMT
jgi:hypothetical protein